MMRKASYFNEIKVFQRQGPRSAPQKRSVDHASISNGFVDITGLLAGNGIISQTYQIVLRKRI